MNKVEYHNNKEFILAVAEYVVSSNETIRKTAKVFGVSKSTIHNLLSKKLKHINFDLYTKVVNIFNYHFSTKHIKGGEVTKNKYMNK